MGFPDWRHDKGVNLVTILSFNTESLYVSPRGSVLPSVGGGGVAQLLLLGAGDGAPVAAVVVAAADNRTVGNSGNSHYAGGTLFFCSRWGISNLQKRQNDLLTPDQCLTFAAKCVPKS